jgi:hypothetical protein
LFSFAYVTAVISAAGYNYSHPRLDYNSVDFSIRGTDAQALYAFPCLDVQLKCTSDARITRDFVHFSRLKRKNYNDLRLLGAQSSILVVVVVPTSIDHWLVSSEKCLRLHRSAYWLSLRGLPARDQEEITVRLPRAQPFTVAGLSGIMTKIEQGGEP